MDNQSAQKERLKFVLRIVLPVVVVLFAFLIAVKVVKNKPKPVKKTVKKMSLLVETKKLSATNEKIIFSAMGKVVASQKISVFSQVPGSIVKLSKNFEEGNYVNKNESLINIDSQDFKIALQLEKAKLEKNQAALELEKGRQQVAASELKMMKNRVSQIDDDFDSALVLRKPQLQQILADIKVSKANVEKKELDLQRTDIKTPFNCYVQNKYVDLGSLVSSQTKIADLIASDEFWVEVLIPYNKLKWIDADEKEGSDAKVFITDDGGYCEQGKVIRFLRNVDDNGRMVKIIIAFKNSDNKEKFPVLINSYVKVEITGKQLNNVFKIARDDIRENNSIWCVKKDKLFVSTFDNIIWKDENYIYASLKEKTIELISSDLTLPISGMPVRRMNRKLKDRKD